MIRSLTFVLLFFVCATVMAAPQHSPWPGGVAIVRIPGEERPLVTVDDQKALVFKAESEWVAIIGIPLDQTVPGTMTANVSLPNEPPRTVEFEIEANTYEEQRLNVDRKYVDPSPEALERIFAERDIIDAALNNWRETSLFDVTLEAPVGGRRSSSYGLRRFFNDQPR